MSKSRNSQKKYIIDVKSLSENDKELLHSLFLTNEQVGKNKKTKIFFSEKNQIYKHLYHGEEVFIQFKQNIVRRTKYKENKLKTYVYTVYDPKEQIGEGGFGKVYRVFGKLRHVNDKVNFSQSKKKQIIKVQTINPAGTNDIVLKHKKEAKLAHESGIKTKKIIFHKSPYPIKTISFIVQSEAPGQAFDEILINKETFTIKERYLLTKLLLDKLKNLHDAGIVNHDIKAEHFFIDGNNHKVQVTLIDYGIALKKNEDNINDILLGIKFDISALGNILRNLWEIEGPIGTEKKIPFTEKINNELLTSGITPEDLSFILHRLTGPLDKIMSLDECVIKINTQLQQIDPELSPDTYAQTLSHLLNNTAALTSSSKIILQLSEAHNNKQEVSESELAPVETNLEYDSPLNSSLSTPVSSPPASPRVAANKADEEVITVSNMKIKKT